VYVVLELGVRDDEGSGLSGAFVAFTLKGERSEDSYSPAIPAEPIGSRRWGRRLSAGGGQETSKGAISMRPVLANTNAQTTKRAASRAPRVARPPEQVELRRYGLCHISTMSQTRQSGH
jgi:hypothetical protein